MTDSITTQTYQYSFQDLSISKKDVCDMAKMEDAAEMFYDFLDEEMQKLEDIDSIKGEVALFGTAKPGPGTIRLNGTEFNLGKMVASYLKNATEAALFICTAGEEVGRRSKELMQKGDLVEGYLVDCLGSIMAEKAIGKIHQELIELATTRELKCSNRYSPGYCHWEVFEQKKLFSYFPEGSCDIKLSDSSLMQPIKSVSGIIGIGPEVRFLDYRCEICSSKNCIYRKIK